MSDVLGYRDGQLCLESVSLAQLAATTTTPFYCYSHHAITKAYQTLQQATAQKNVHIHYAVKACSNLAVLKLLHQLGAGMDIVSQGEMQRCLAAGIKGEAIIFSGVGKTDDEIAFALHHHIHRFNVESLPELAAINRVAAKLGVTAPIALRINPDIDAKTHAKITTGKKDNKFGIGWDGVENAYRQASRLPHLRPMGLTMHIGSQITEAAPFRHAFARMEVIVSRLRQQGHRITEVGLGGGLGIAYNPAQPPDIQGYGTAVQETANRLACRVELEPGRFLVGEAGILVTRVLYVKQGTEKKFLIVDAAMNDLLRPTLYEAHHPMLAVTQPLDNKQETYDVVGPICETGDYLALNRTLPALAAGDLLAVTHAGAYGAAMASTYNSRPLIAEILVKGETFSTIRPMVSVAQQLAWEKIPDWL